MDSKHAPMPQIDAEVEPQICLVCGGRYRDSALPGLFRCEVCTSPQRT